MKPWNLLMWQAPCFHQDYLPTFHRPTSIIRYNGKGNLLKSTPTGGGQVFEGAAIRADG